MAVDRPLLVGSSPPELLPQRAVKTEIPPAEMQRWSHSDLTWKLKDADAHERIHRPEGWSTVATVHEEKCKGDRMPQTSRINRISFAVAALLLVVALCLHIANWYRRGFVDWPAAGNMTGLFVLMATGLFDPQRGPLRAGITVVALGLILPSAYFLVAKAAG